MTIMLHQALMLLCCKEQLPDTPLTVSVGCRREGQPSLPAVEQVF